MLKRVHIFLKKYSFRKNRIISTINAYLKDQEKSIVCFYFMGETLTVIFLLGYLVLCTKALLQ